VNGQGGGNAIKVDHNTVTTDGNSALTLGDTAPYGSGFRFTNNIVPHGSYGIFGGGQGEGTVALSYYLTSYVVTNNAIVGGGSPGAYPAGNVFPASLADLGSYQGGADMPALNAATAGVAP